MKKPLCIRVTGPLESCVPGFLDHLTEQGYTSWSATSYLALLSQLSRWLVQRDLTPDELTSPLVDQFLVYRRERGYAKGKSGRGMVRVMLAYLRTQGTVPEAEPAAIDGAVQCLLAEYTEYLATERGLAVVTIVGYRRHAASFFEAVWKDESSPVADCFTARAVTQFMLTEAGHRKRGALNDLAVQCRSVKAEGEGGRQATPITIGWAGEAWGRPA